MNAGCVIQQFVCGGSGLLADSRQVVCGGYGLFFDSR
jgi:hypothetical protein